MIGEDSRFNYSIVIRTVNTLGEPVENERIHLPYARERIVNIVRPDLQEYRVQDGDTWSNLAARFLRGRSDLWWVLAEFSGVLDPFDELVPGRLIKVPQFDTVMFEVLNFEEKQQGSGLSDLALSSE